MERRLPQRRRDLATTAGSRVSSNLAGGGRAGDTPAASEGTAAGVLDRPLSARRLARLLASGRSQLTRADAMPVAAVIGQPWSNGPTEAQMIRLKLVKRQTYGRAKLDLLAAGFVGHRLTSCHRKCVRAQF